MEKLLTLREARAVLGLSPHTLRSWARLRKLPVIRLGARRLRVRPADLEALMKKSHVPALAGNGR